MPRPLRNGAIRARFAATAFCVALASGGVSGLAPAAHAQTAADDGLIGPLLAGRIASARNDYAEAAMYLDRVLRHTTEDPRAIDGAIMARIALADYDAALALVDSLPDARGVSQAAALILLSRDFVRADHAGALGTLDGAPVGGPLVDGLARAWAQLGDGRMSDALAAFEAVIDGEGTAVFGEFNKAIALAMVGDYESADLILSGETAGPLPLDRRGVIARAQILSQLERQSDAVALLDAAFGPGPDADLATLRAALDGGAQVPFDMVESPRDGMAEVFYMLAEALRGDAGNEYTLLFARLAEYLRPDHTPATLLSGRLLTGLDQYELAVAAFDGIAQDDPHYHIAQVGRADALFSSGDPDAAIAAVQALLDTHSGIASIHITLGDFLRRESRWEEAAQAYEAAIAMLGEAQPQHWAVYYTRAIVYERDGRWPEAEADFRTALRLNPDEPHVLNYLGYSLVEQRENLEEALDMIERAVEGEPENGYITDSLGWAFYRLGRYEEAVPVMERAVELATTDPVINDHLGDVYWAVGRVREARFQWRRALSFGPSDDLDMDRVRSKLEVGLDQVLINEGAEPHLAGAHGN